MKKKILLAFTMVIMIAMVMVGCSNSSSGNSNNNKDNNASKSNNTTNNNGDNDKVELSMITMFGGTDPATDVFKDKLKAFMEENPNITVTEESMTSGDEFRTKVNTAYSGGDEPDLLYYFIGSDAKPLIDAGKFAPLDDMLADDSEWKDGFNPSALEQVKADDGHTYAIPLTGFYEGLLVNKELFEENNLELPTDWDKYEKAIKTFSKKGIVPLAAGLPESYYLIETYILSAGGPDGHNAAFTDGINPSWEKGLNQLKADYKAGAFPKDTLTIKDADAQNLFNQGQAAMFIDGSWVVGGLPDDMQSKVEVLPLPVMPDGESTYGDLIAGFSSGFYISQTTYDNDKKKDAAEKLLKFLTSKDSIKDFAEANSGTPAANVTPAGLTDAAQSGLKVVADANSLSFPIDSQISTEAFTYIRTNVPQIVAGKKSAKEVLEKAEKLNEDK